jgi:hypothetical protein
MYRDEANVGEQLPTLPEVPRLHRWFEALPWVVLIFEDVDGAPPTTPWKHAELVRVLEALADLATRLTPTPALGLPTVIDKHADDFDGWARLARDPDRLRTADGDGWLTDHLQQLDRFAQGWSAARAGNTLLHADIRADQLLLTDERVYLVDWAHACVGADFVDPLLFFPSVVLDGGPTIDELVTLSHQTREAGPTRLASVASAAASFFIERSTRPPPPGLPTVRDFSNTDRDRYSSTGSSGSCDGHQGSRNDTRDPTERRVTPVTATCRSHHGVASSAVLGCPQVRTPPAQAGYTTTGPSRASGSSCQSTGVVVPSRQSVRSRA